jgi:uncharacterized protein (DUF924 family)
MSSSWADAVLHFWFHELGEAHWFAKSEDVDTRIRNRFLPLHEHLMQDATPGVAAPYSLLAAVIVMDQFSRNLFRGTARAFAADPGARQLSKSAIQQGFDLAMNAHERLFLYLPFQHNEAREDQALAVDLIGRLGNEAWTRDALVHKAIIDRFGRFPHRNTILNRQSSADELALLSHPEKWF